MRNCFLPYPLRFARPPTLRGTKFVRVYYLVWSRTPSSSIFLPEVRGGARRAVGSVYYLLLQNLIYICFGFTEFGATESNKLGGACYTLRQGIDIVLSLAQRAENGLNLLHRLLVGHIQIFSHSFLLFLRIWVSFSIPILFYQCSIKNWKMYSNLYSFRLCSRHCRANSQRSRIRSNSPPDPPIRCSWSR